MTFVCPTCGVRGARRCDRATVLELVAGGAVLTRLTVPDEVDDPVRRGSRIEACRQMFEMLEDHTWLDHLVELR